MYVLYVMLTYVCVCVNIRVSCMCVRYVCVCVYIGELYMRVCMYVLYVML